MNIDRFQEIIQSCHLNFLIGSGCSMPFLKTLGMVETYLTEAEHYEPSDTDTRKLVKASILKQYFDESVYSNTALINPITDEKCQQVLANYKALMKAVSHIVLCRKSSILNKQVNLFTTNMDLFIERAIEEQKIDLNDGFIGRMNPEFNLTNFRKSILKTSSHYDNVSEVPVFNLYKLHGSVNWKMGTGDTILFDAGLDELKHIQEVRFKEGEIVSLRDNELQSIRHLKEIFDEAAFVPLSENHRKFLAAYERLPIINPTKEKFKHTTLHYTYYELLRLFSNAMEKENTVLFVMGFSFSDEHIREIVLRSLNSNPTLVIAVFAYDEISENQIKQNLRLSAAPLKYDNLFFVPRRKEGDKDEEKEHHLRNIITYYFATLSHKVSDKQEVAI